MMGVEEALDSFMVLSESWRNMWWKFGIFQTVDDIWHFCLSKLLMHYWYEFFICQCPFSFFMSRSFEMEFIIFLLIGMLVDLAFLICIPWGFFCCWLFFCALTICAIRWADEYFLVVTLDWPNLVVKDHWTNSMLEENVQWWAGTILPSGWAHPELWERKREREAVHNTFGRRRCALDTTWLTCLALEFFSNVGLARQMTPLLTNSSSRLSKELLLGNSTLLNV